MTTLQAMMALIIMGQKAGEDLNGDERTKVVRGPFKGADDHREVGLGMEMTMMEMTTMTLMTVIASLSVA